jgi:hypothetical protein
LSIRLFLGPNDFGLLSAGAAGNAAAIAAFVATLIAAAVAWRVQHSPSSRSRHAIPARH